MTSYDTPTSWMLYHSVTQFMLFPLLTQSKQNNNNKIFGKMFAKISNFLDVGEYKETFEANLNEGEDDEVR